MVQTLIVRRDGMLGPRTVVDDQNRGETEETTRKVRNHHKPKMYSQREFIV